MKRRDVIKLGALGLAVGSAPSCVVPRKISALDGADGAIAFNKMLDDQLGRLGKPGLLHKLVAQKTGKKLSTETQEKINARDVLFRRMLSTVLVTQGFRELPEETRYEPAVQGRMWQHADLISSMVFEVSDMLSNLDGAQRKAIQQQLQADPDLPMSIGEALDEKMGAAGMSRARRRQMRAMMSKAAFRLRTQDPGAMIDEYVDKVERLRPSTAADGTNVTLAEKLGEREFWRAQRMRMDDPGTASQAPGASLPPPPAGPGAGSGSGWGTGSGVRSASGAPAPPDLPALLQNAKDAAARGDCRSVYSLGRYIHQVDAEFFRANFAPDQALAACVHKVSAEDRANAQRMRWPLGQQTAEEEEPKKHHAGETGIRAGGYMLGIGVLTFFVSWGAIAATEEFAFVFGMTLGAVLVAIGLLTLLISALIYAAND